LKIGFANFGELRDGSFLVLKARAVRGGESSIGFLPPVALSHFSVVLNSGILLGKEAKTKVLLVKDFQMLPLYDFETLQNRKDEFANFRILEIIFVNVKRKGKPGLLILGRRRSQRKGRARCECRRRLLLQLGRCLQLLLVRLGLLLLLLLLQLLLLLVLLLLLWWRLELRLLLLRLGRLSRLGLQGASRDRRGGITFLILTGA